MNIIVILNYTLLNFKLKKAAWYRWPVAGLHGTGGQWQGEGYSLVLASCEVWLFLSTLLLLGIMVNEG